MRTTRTAVNGNGGSTRFRGRESRGTKPGKGNRGKSADRRRGLPGRTIRKRTLRFGLREILRHRIAAKGARGTICIPIRCWRSIRTRGKLKWHFQFTQHDEHDYDATQVPVMMNEGGKKLIVQANRNGFFYVIDRNNGKLIRAESYAKVSWIESQGRDWTAGGCEGRFADAGRQSRCARARRERPTGCRRRTIRRRNCFT